MSEAETLISKCCIKEMTDEKNTEVQKNLSTHQELITKVTAHLDHHTERIDEKFDKLDKKFHEINKFIGDNKGDISKNRENIMKQK